MSQIRVLSAILKVLVPIKEAHDELHVPRANPAATEGLGESAAATAAVARGEPATVGT